MTGLKIFYRLSDKGEAKQKLPGISNRACLENFVEHFGWEDIALVADNVSDETFAWLETLPLGRLTRTSLGNCGSFWACFEQAMELDDASFAYFVENDYLHRAGARDVLLEGLGIADYVTLYDHPDKYCPGENPLIRNGGERTKVLLTRSCHWKLTNSTTMTFAGRVGTLRRDRLVFKNFTVGLIPGQGWPLRFFQRKRVPDDYRLFRFLIAFRGRTLASPLPGYSTHGEVRYIAPFFAGAALDGDAAR